MLAIKNLTGLCDAIPMSSLCEFIREMFAVFGDIVTFLWLTLFQLAGLPDFVFEHNLVAYQLIAHISTFKEFVEDQP